MIRTVLGGDQEAQGPPGGNAPGGQRTVILIPSHFRDRRGAYGCGGRDARGAHRGKNGTGTQGRNGQAPGQFAEDPVGHPEEGRPQPRMKQDASHQKKKRQDKPVVIGDESVRDGGDDAEGRLQINYIGKSEKPDQGHGNADGRP